MAAEVFTPNSIIASVPWDGGGWNAHPGHVAAPQAQRMTLLKLEKMRTLMLHNVLGHSNKSRSREGIVPYDSTPDNVDSGNDVSGFPFILPSPILRATRPAADQVEVERLVALDVEELVRHTVRRSDGKDVNSPQSVRYHKYDNVLSGVPIAPHVHAGQSSKSLDRKAQRLIHKASCCCFHIVLISY